MFEGLALHKPIVWLEMYCTKVIKASPLKWPFYYILDEV
jgi:hypothetical protein